MYIYFTKAANATDTLWQKNPLC